MTPRPDDLAYTIFTSGSTGSPKGVEIQHRAARVTIDDVVDRFSIGPEDRVLALSALSFDLSVFDIYGVLGAGGSLVLPDPARQRDPEHWLEQAGRHGVTVWNTAPALLEMLVEYAEMEPDTAATALSTLRLVMLSGDWIPLNLPDRLRRLAPQARVMSLGGATEASIWSITYPVERVDPRWRSIPYGRALRGQSFLVLDEDGAPCPVGEAGELFIGGDALARGYTADPVQSAERFAVHPVLGRRLYRTGDMGRWTAEGTIEFLGRVDRQVKIRGHRIELGEIEAVLGRHPAVRQCVVSSVPGPDGRPRLVAHLSPRGASAPPTAGELAQALRERLPDYMVPGRFVVLDQLPVTANGKIDHAALTAAPAGARSAGAPAPGTASPAGPPTDQLPEDTGTVPAVPSLSSPGSDSTAAAVGEEWVTAALAEAAALGLEAALVVRPGRLRPDQALDAAARWLRNVARTTDGTTTSPRLSADGLAEVVCRPGGNSDATPGTAFAAPPAACTDRPLPAATPAPGPAVAADRRTTASRGGSGHGSATAVDPTVLEALTVILRDFTEEPVTSDSTFGALGATSLTLVLTHRRLRESIAPRLTLADMFAHPTVAALAARITAQRAIHTADATDTAAPTVDDTPSTPPHDARPTRRTSRVAARALAEETTR